MSTLSRWIHAAVMRKVKRLDLMFCPKEESDDIQIPHSLVTCDSLEVLKLCLLGSRLSLPNSTGFQALRVIVLNNVEFVDDYSVKCFFQNCPLLEDLSLFDCCTHNLYALEISCPNLKRLTIIYRDGVGYEEFCKDKGMCDDLRVSCPKLVFLMLTGYVAGVLLFESLCSLKKAVIHPQDLCEDERPVIDGFNGISHVEFLSISLYYVAMCYYPPKDPPVSLPNLKTLELTNGAFAMNDLIPFLVCFPDLESLHLIITQVTQLEEWKLDDVAAMKVLTRCLKLVEFVGFDGEEQKVALARSLLQHGKALEDMTFLWGKEAEYHEKSIKAMKEISNFHKASSTVKLRCVIKSPHL